MSPSSSQILRFLCTFSLFVLATVTARAGSVQKSQSCEWLASSEIAICGPFAGAKEFWTEETSTFQAVGDFGILEIIRGLEAPNEWGDVTVLQKIRVLGTDTSLLDIETSKAERFQGVFLDSARPDGSSLLVRWRPNGTFSSTEVASVFDSISYVNDPSALCIFRRADKSVAVLDELGRSTTLSVGDVVTWWRGEVKRIRDDTVEYQYFDFNAMKWKRDELPIRSQCCGKLDDNQRS